MLAEYFTEVAENFADVVLIDSGSRVLAPALLGEGIC